MADVTLLFPKKGEAKTHSDIIYDGMEAMRKCSKSLMDLYKLDPHVFNSVRFFTEYNGHKYKVGASAYLALIENDISQIKAACMTHHQVVAQNMKAMESEVVQ